MFDRRTVMGFTAMLAALPGLAKAQANAQSSQQEGLPLAPTSGPGVKPPLPSFDIWPGNPPGGENVTAEEKVVLRHPGGDPNDTAYYHVRKPWLTVRKPDKPNGAAILIAPGGGYVRVAVSKVGGDLDGWLAGQGYTVFTMDYRLPGDHWAAGPDVALQDVQRAIRLIRSKSAGFGLNPARIGVAGFSAGGHVAGLAATRFNDAAYAPIDAVDTLSAKPTVVAMCYPVVTATLPYAHAGSVNELIGKNPTDEQRARASVEQHVPADAAPTFVCGTTDDPVVPMHNAMLMFEALKAQKIPSELHLYEGATHGFPLRDKAGNVQPWALAALAFMERHGLKA